MRSHLKILGILIAAFVLAAAVAIPAAGSSEAARMASLHDQARSEHGLASLARASDLTSGAQRHAEEMAARGEIYHSGMTHTMGGWAAMGENVGRGATVDDIFSMFMDSATHRANVLDSSWDSMGVGLALSDAGDTFVAVLFGQRMQSPPRHAAPAVKQPKPSKSSRPRVVKVAPAPAHTLPAPSVRSTPVPEAPLNVPAVAAPAPEAALPPDPHRALGVLLAVADEHAPPAPPGEAAALGDVSVQAARARFAESEAERRREAESRESGAAARALGGNARCWHGC